MDAHQVIQKRGKPLRTLLSVLIIATWVSFALGGCARQPALSSSLRKPDAAATVLQPATTATAEPAVVMEKRVRYPIYAGNPASSLEEAKSRVNFSVLVPKVLPAGYKLEAILTSFPQDAPTEYVRFVYTDGKHHLLVGQAIRDPALRTFTDEEIAELGQQKIAVGGFPGMGHGPGVSQTKEARQEYGSVTWWPPGLRRSVWTVDDATLSLEDLLAVAESMEAAS